MNIMGNRKSMSGLRIVSRSSEPFQDRSQAGEMLARELAELRGQNTVVLGIPRGGLILARSLARGIGADLDIVLSRKLGAIYQTELAMGALAESGEMILNQDVVDGLSIPQEYIEQEENGRRLSCNAAAG